MGVKGFQKGHIVSKETRMKISKANDGNFFAKCDYCGEKYHTNNLIMKKVKDTSAAVNVIRLIVKKLCHRKNKTHTVLDITLKKDTRERKQG